MRYTGKKTSRISFPLGGIGSGCIGLGGDGRLAEWEIFNRPAKGVKNGLSHFAVKAVSGGKLLDARVLAGELAPPYMDGGERHYCRYGFVPGNDTCAGFPNFRSVEFVGEYPIAKLHFRDPDFPGAVSLTAFNPFIPLNDKDSSLPAAFFEISFTNPTRQRVEYTAAFSVQNPAANSINHAIREKGVSLIRLHQADPRPADPGYGEVAVATDAARATLQEYWFRSFHFDRHRVFWKDFASAKALPKRTYQTPGNTDHATVAATVAANPGETVSVRFVVSWHYPNCTNYWFKLDKFHPEKPKVGNWKNYYATLFPDASASVLYAMRHWDRLFRETSLFKEALFSSTLPASILDAVSANISILKTPTVLRLEDGSFYGWEGVNGDAGSCEGSCTHVWNYAYALPFLFPRLERSMRDLNYRHNLRDDGGLVFRLELPPGAPMGTHRPCCDGQFGDVIKVYRDWKICGDTAWLRELWPSIKKTIAFAWSPRNEDRWDPERSGVLTGRQHHTLDRELFGPNAWLTGFYLGALKAASEMAIALGEKEAAAEYDAIFRKGKKWMDKHLFNGEFYFQKINLKDRSVPEKFKAVSYWSEEHGQISHQIGEGSGIDQVVAQWHANLCGLGEIFDARQRKTALSTMFRHNFKRTMRGTINPCRVFTLYDESGVVICVWPDPALKPAVPVPYSEETMYGFEYAAAALMIQEGLIEEGLEIVERGRRRFDGLRRNPWNEFECGSNYARSMSSYSLLPALSGFEYDLNRGMIGFSPKLARRTFSCFWSLASGWGKVRFSPGRIVLEVLWGSLELREFHSARLQSAAPASVRIGSRKAGFDWSPGQVLLRDPERLLPGKNLKIALHTGSPSMVPLDPMNLRSESRSR